jgi:cellulase
MSVFSLSYLIRAEMIGLHEADASYEKNPMRGAQFYPNCVQIEVVGNGTVELPPGVSFPGAYKYSDPGIVYDVGFCIIQALLATSLKLTLSMQVYCSTKTKPTVPCTSSLVGTYPIPGEILSPRCVSLVSSTYGIFVGPTVWTGAWPDTTAVELGPIVGETTAPRWSSWVQRSVVTSATFEGNQAKVVATSVYTPTWSSVYTAPTATAV